MKVVESCRSNFAKRLFVILQLSYFDNFCRFSKEFGFSEVIKHNYYNRL